MEEQLRSLHLHDAVTRWPATDASGKLDLASIVYVPGRWKAPKWQLTDVEIAVFESHRRIWQQVAETGGGPVVVLEDDTLLSERFCNVITLLTLASDGYDVVKLDGIDKVRRFGAPMFFGANSSSDIVVRPIFQTISSAAGYMLSNEGANKLMMWSSSYSDGVDDFLFRPRKGYHLFQLFPAVCAQGTTLLPKQELQEQQSFLVRGESSATYRYARKHKGPMLFRMIREVRRGIRRLGREFFSDKQIYKEDGFIGKVPLEPDLCARYGQ